MSARATTNRQLTSGEQFSDKTFHSMDDKILTTQNDPFLLQCLIAQKSEYSRAKKAGSKKLIFIILFTIFSIYSTTNESDLLSAIASLLAVGLLIYNKHSDKQISSLQKHAASIQQYFDVTLFSSAIGGTKEEWGELPNKSDLANSISNIIPDNKTDVGNWYNVCSSLPITTQIFYCQRENVRWERELRQSYIHFQIWIFIFITSVTLASLLYFNPSAVKVISTLSCLLSIGEHVYSACRQIIENISRLQKIESLCEYFECRRSEDGCQPSKNDLIRLQCKIRENRESCYLIPDWFYELNKKEQHKKEDIISKTIAYFHQENERKK